LAPVFPSLSDTLSIEMEVAVWSSLTIVPVTGLPETPAAFIGLFRTTVKTSSASRLRSSME